MGQQQILLLVLSAILVGVAVIIGITLFHDNEVDLNRDAMITDMMDLAVKAKRYYSLPRTGGGGGFSFVGLEGAAGLRKLASTSFTDNSNATYEIIDVTASRLVIQGIGKATLGDDTHPIMTLTVLPHRQFMTIEN